jgi:hypothetical protein
VFVVLGIKPRTLHMLGKFFTSELCPQPLVSETRSCYVAQSGLELSILLTLPPEC